MGINKQKFNKKPTVSKKEVSKNCKVDNRTIVFSLKYLVSLSEYNLEFFQKHSNNAIKCLQQLEKKLIKISSMTFDEFYKLDRKSGYELIPVSQIDRKLITDLSNKNLVLTDDQYIYSSRFMSQSARLLFKRGTKCDRVMQVLALDFGLNAYKH